MFSNILHQWQEQPVAEILMFHQWQEPTEHQFSNAMKQEYLTRTTRQQYTLERCAHTVVFGDLQDNAINHVLMRSNKKCYISSSQPRTHATSVAVNQQSTTHEATCCHVTTKHTTSQKKKHNLGKQILVFHQWQEPTENEFSNAMKQSYLPRTTHQQHPLETCAHAVVFGER